MPSIDLSPTSQDAQLIEEVDGQVARQNRNRLLASLKADDFFLLSGFLREVPIKQGQILEVRGERVDAVYFP